MVGKTVRVLVGPNKDKTGIVASEWLLGKRWFYILDNGIRASQYMIEVL